MSNYKKMKKNKQRKKLLQNFTYTNSHSYCTSSSDYGKINKTY